MHVLKTNTAQQRGHLLRIASLLGGVLKFKDAAEQRPQASYEARIVLLWLAAFAVKYTGVRGAHLDLELRLAWLSVNTTLNFYPSLP